MIKKTFIVLLICIGSMSSCDYKWIETEPLNLPEGPVRFSEQILPIFQNNCIACHSNTSPVLTEDVAFNNLTQGGYVNTAEPKESELYEKVKGGHPGGSNSLSNRQVAIILKWIEEGAQNN